MKNFFHCRLLTVLALFTIAGLLSCKKQETESKRNSQVVRLTTDKVILEVGEDSVLRTTFIPEVGAPANQFKWEIENPAVAGIVVNNDFSINITAKSTGQTQAIMYGLNGKKYAICDVNVIPVPNPTVTLNTQEGSLYIGGELTLVPTFTPSVNRLPERYKWESENPQIAELSVNADFSAKVSGKKLGDTKVILKTRKGDKILATALIHVIEEPIIGELKEPVLINFGNAAGVPAEWNTLSTFTAGSTISNLKDKTLEPTDISVTITERFNGANETGEASTTTDLNMPASVSKTAFFGNARADWGGLFKQATLKFEGLNKELKYDFCFYGSRAGVGDNREAKYIVKGANEVAASLNASANKTNIACAEKVQPDANGVITVIVTMGDNNNNGTGFYYLNAMRLAAAGD